MQITQIEQEKNKKTLSNEGWKTTGMNVGNEQLRAKQHEFETNSIWIFIEIKTFYTALPTFPIKIVSFVDFFFLFCFAEIIYNLSLILITQYSILILFRRRKVFQKFRITFKMIKTMKSYALQVSQLIALRKMIWLKKKEKKNKAANKNSFTTLIEMVAMLYEKCKKWYKVI